jgi:hypothetical protein
MRGSYICPVIVFLGCCALFAQPHTVERTHSVGNMNLTVSNWGFIGSQRGDDSPYHCVLDSEGVCGIPFVCRPSCERPACSGVEYLFQGALWIGAVVAGDTLVSVGEDGWETNINDFKPGFNPLYSRNQILEYSIDSLDTEALGNQTFIAYYSDTLTNTLYVHSAHNPIGLEIKQKTHQWSSPEMDNFVIYELWLTNIRTDHSPLQQVYFGVYMDGDVGDVDVPNYSQDDLTGFMRYYIDTTVTPPESTLINTAWLADNDGDPVDSAFDSTSCTGALMVTILSGYTSYSYNWWISNTDETYDWGPDSTFGCALLHFDGTPTGDVNKYNIMSRHGSDYNQCRIEDFSMNSHWEAQPSDPCWVVNMADGFDTRFLLSFGPYNIPYNSTAYISFAISVADSFHNEIRPASNPYWDCDFNYDAIGKQAKKLLSLYSELTGIEEHLKSKPTLTLQTHPNPFNSTCVITAPTGTKVEIFDLNGKCVCSLRQAQGTTSDIGSDSNDRSLSLSNRPYNWSPDKNTPSGVYLVRATTADGQSVVKRVVLVR